MWMCALVLATGCDGIDLRKLVTQHEARTRVATEPAGPNCEHGGKAVLSGLDLDEDGVLGDDEVTGTEYVCATLAPGVLVRTRQLPPGEPCALGGQLTLAGTDLDGDGVLSDVEVTREVHGCLEPAPVLAQVRPLLTPPFVCRYDNALMEAGVDLNGNGVLDDDELRAAARLCADPAVTLLRQRPEPAGPDCTAGGTRVEAGVDDNRNTALDDAEVRATAYVCQRSATHDGTYAVENAADLEALKSLTSIRGDLSIENTEVTAVVLPGLVSVEGSLSIHGNPGLMQVHLPGLRYVGETLSIRDSAQLNELRIGPQTLEALPPVRVHSLALASLPAVSSLSGLAAVTPRFDLSLLNTGVLWSPGTFPHVQALAGSLTLHANPALELLPLSALAQVDGSILISGNPMLQSLEGLGPLTMVGGGLDISSNNALTHLSGLEQLSAVKSVITVMNNARLLDVRFDGLREAGSLIVAGNAVLEQVGPMPSLFRVQGDVSLAENPRLLRATELPALQSMGGALFVTLNPLLTDLSGFQQVTWMSGLYVTGNAALEDLGTLGSLHTVGTLEVRENAAMTALHLDALARVRDAFIVTDNPRLPSCWATMLADDVYTGPPEERRIWDNDSVTPCQL
ncbi:putative lipoprotein [Corallococcus macrosporus]|uniref:Putative lipoprotein n=2 Tax=Myxococcaceae TaxID=31 RepID=F8C913_MYXFH|nr:putative lipoprotein [Corallococcus macrosporus]